MQLNICPTEGTHCLFFFFSTRALQYFTIKLLHNSKKGSIILHEFYRVYRISEKLPLCQRSSQNVCRLLSCFLAFQHNFSQLLNSYSCQKRVFVRFSAEWTFLTLTHIISTDWCFQNETPLKTWNLYNRAKVLEQKVQT